MLRLHRRIWPRAEWKFPMSFLGISEVMLCGTWDPSIDNYRGPYSITSCLGCFVLSLKLFWGVAVAVSVPEPRGTYLFESGMVSIQLCDFRQHPARAVRAFTRTSVKLTRQRFALPYTVQQGPINSGSEPGTLKELYINPFRVKTTPSRLFEVPKILNGQLGVLGFAACGGGVHESQKA